MLRPSHRDTPVKCDWLHSIINLLLYVKHMPILYCRQNNFYSTNDKSFESMIFSILIVVSTLHASSMITISASFPILILPFMSSMPNVIA